MPQRKETHDPRSDDRALPQDGTDRFRSHLLTDHHSYALWWRRSSRSSVRFSSTPCWWRWASTVFPATAGYVHFQFSDYAKLTVVGVIVACAAWPIVSRLTSAPRWLFSRLAVARDGGALGPRCVAVGEGPAAQRRRRPCGHASRHRPGDVQRARPHRRASTARGTSRLEEPDATAAWRDPPGAGTAARREAGTGHCDGIRDARPRRRSLRSVDHDVAKGHREETHHCLDHHHGIPRPRQRRPP